MLVAAVSGIDHRDGGFGGRHVCGSLFGVAHGADVSVAGDHADRIGNTLAFGRRAGISRRDAEDAAAQAQHGGFKAQPCSGAGLKKKSRQLFAVTYVGIFGAILFDVRCQG